MSETWRGLNSRLSALTEAEVAKLLEQERKGPKRMAHLLRLHQRLCVLRTSRERMELLRLAEKS